MVHIYEDWLTELKANGQARKMWHVLKTTDSMSFVIERYSTKIRYNKLSNINLQQLQEINLNPIAIRVYPNLDCDWTFSMRTRRMFRKDKIRVFAAVDRESLIKWIQHLRVLLPQQPDHLLLMNSISSSTSAPVQDDEEENSSSTSINSSNSQRSNSQSKWYTDVVTEQMQIQPNILKSGSGSDSSYSSQHLQYVQVFDDPHVAEDVQVTLEEVKQHRNSYHSYVNLSPMNTQSVSKYAQIDLCKTKAVEQMRKERQQEVSYCRKQTRCSSILSTSSSVCGASNIYMQTNI